tara:strand:+ start:418 stop:585 length:168 start_codon:yes stop_codon:yes gene_type:complete
MQEEVVVLTVHHQVVADLEELVVEDLGQELVELLILVVEVVVDTQVHKVEQVVQV